MWKLTGVSVDLLEGRLFFWGERVGRSEIWRMNFTSKLAEDFHVPLFVCLFVCLFEKKNIDGTKTQCFCRCFFFK